MTCTPVYEAAHSVIRQRDIEALVKQKPQSAFDTITAHNEAASEFSEAEERYNGVNRELEEANMMFMEVQLALVVTRPILEQNQSSRK
ncbi:hypothetical protein Hanom_Chr03g00267281 [Helianthus anomalus]